MRTEMGEGSHGDGSRGWSDITAGSWLQPRDVGDLLEAGEARG